MEKKQNNYRHILKPLSNKKLTKYDFIGFDVETYGNNNKFYMGGLYYFINGKEIFKTFTNRIEMIDFILTDKFKGKYFVATNLGFDLTTLFFNTPFWNDLNILESGSNIIYADYKFKNSNKKGKVKFIDTMNYLPFSVEKLGSILNIPKLNKPKCLGKLPKTEEEREELFIYNKRDCEISCLFMYFLQDGLNKSGGILKITIASSSFDIWRRNFLNQILYKEELQHKFKGKNIKEFIFNGYYGGRTEVYKKGEFKELYYYDINSLYPSVMLKKFPLPQSIKEVPKNSVLYINNYFGVSEVTVECPKMHKPFLPYRDIKKKKLLFPYGTFRGVWNNHELKKAIKLGYKIKKIHKQIIYTKTFYPFKEFVEYFYNERLKYKKDKNPMQLVSKLILNSLYGKFGQKKVKEFKIIDLNDFNGDFNELNKLVGDNYTEKDNLIISTEEKEYNGKNVYPILASYVTSYARILMYDYINNDDVIYTDTDSIFITKPLYNDSKKLGEMKLEDGSPFKMGYFVKPKFYFTIDNNDNEVTKIKGISRASKDDFYNILKGKSVTKMKFTKLKESIRRGFNPNTKLMLNKLLSLDDNKRVWIKQKDILISEGIKLNEVQ